MYFKNWYNVSLKDYSEKNSFKNKRTKIKIKMQAQMLFHLGNFILVTMEMVPEETRIF